MKAQMGEISMSDATEQILKFCQSSLQPADNAALSDMLKPSANDDELSTQTALRTLAFLRDKMPFADVSKLIDMLGEVVDYDPAQDLDIEEMPAPPKTLTGGILTQELKAMAAGEDDPPAFSGRPTVGGVPGQDGKRRCRPRSFAQLAFDTVLRRGGNKAAAKAEAAAADYAKRWPEIARVSGLPTYGAAAKPQAARTPLTMAAQDAEYAKRWPDAMKIMH
jgi:hypothetical protein